MAVLMCGVKIPTKDAKLIIWQLSGLQMGYILVHQWMQSHLGCVYGDIIEAMTNPCNNVYACTTTRDNVSIPFNYIIEG